MAVQKPIAELLDDELRALVGSRWHKRRLRAVEQLRSVAASKAIPVLVKMLQDRELRVGDAAADALRDDFGPAGRAAMRVVLDQNDQWPRLAVERSFAVERDPELRELDQVLKDPDLDEWGPAIERLVSVGIEARPLIERQLVDRNAHR